MLDLINEMLSDEFWESFTIDELIEIISFTLDQGE